MVEMLTSTTRICYNDTELIIADTVLIIFFAGKDMGLSTV